MSDLGAAVKAELALKANLASPTFTGTVVMPSTTSIGTVSNTEISYLDGVTSNIQTQLNSKQATLVSATNIKTVNGTSLLGSGDLAIVSGGGGLPANSQTFTTSGTFTVPAGVDKVYVMMANAGAGGGGGGGWYTGAQLGGDGGGGSASVFGVPFLRTVTPGQNITVTVGAGGAGGAAATTLQGSGGNGGSGGQSSFGLIIAQGSTAIGGGGTGSTTSLNGGGGGGAGSYGGAGGAGGPGGGGPGGAGSIGYYRAYTAGTGGLASSGGAGTGGTSDAENGNNGQANSAARTAGAGGAGGAGKVIVYW